MGYRSVVAAAVTVDRVVQEGEYKEWDARPYDKQKFKEVVGKLKLLITDEYLLNNIGWQDGVITFYNDWTKWYQSYPEVQQWGELWQALQEEEGVSGVFVRLGEETDDIEQESFGDDPVYDLCQIERSVNINPIIVKEVESAQEQAEQGA